MTALPTANGTIDASASNWPRGIARVGLIAVISLLVAAIYLPTAPTQFDFLDDGALVHSQGVQSFADFNRSVWTTTLNEFYNKGPYRPVAWCFWIGQQECFGENPLLWRSLRFAWTVLATGTLLWLLSEFGFGVGVSVLTTVLSIWNPYRAEVWMSLTHCEGIAMPIAMAGLVCAFRASRSQHAWSWDVAAMVCAMMAVGCKNVFAVVIPAQMFLRVCHPELSLWAGVKQFGWRALLLSLVVAFPVAHFVCYRLTMNANRYDMAWDAAQLPRLLNGFLGGMNKDFLGPALIAALVVIAFAYVRGWLPTPTSDERIRFRAAFGAGAILFVLGFGIYVPINAVAGRYTMPGAWGLDLLCALLWVNVSRIPSFWKRVPYVLLAGGLAVTLVSMIGKQEKYYTRIENLWDVVHAVETDVPVGARIGWVGVADRGRTDDLEFSDGVHFAWHLNARGRRDLQWQDLPAGEPIPVSADAPQYLVTSAETVAPARAWTLMHHCQREYWLGRKQVNCYVWQRANAVDTALVPALPTSRVK